MHSKIKMVYWKGEKFWLGKILEHPEIMSQDEPPMLGTMEIPGKDICIASLESFLDILQLNN